MLWVLNADQGGGSTSRLLNLWSYNGFLYLNTGDSAQNPFQDDDGNNVPNKIDNLWHHYATVFTDNKCLLYIDGVYCGKAKIYRNPTTTNNFIRIFGGFQTGHAYDLSGYMNDFRVYDHSLSVKEVKEISKGLVVHYKMDSDSNHINLLTKDFEKRDSEQGQTSSNEYMNICNPLTIYETYGLVKYKVTFDIKSAVSHSFSLYGNPGKNLKYIFDATYIDVTTEWTTISYTFTPRVSTPTGTWASISVYGTYGSGAVVSVRRVSLELVNDVIYDVSGYGNNGEITGSVSLAGGGPRYSKNTKIDGTNNYIIPPAIIQSTTTEFSIAAWVNVITLANGYGPLYSSRVDVSGKGVVLWLTNTGFRFDDGSMWTVSYTWPKNTWVHICFTRSTSGKKIYVNGNLVASTNAVGNLSSINSTARIWQDQYSSNLYYIKGNVSDYRIYCTALSAEDIKELYDTGQVIDKGGNFYCYELNEESTQPELLKTGIVKANELIEIKLLDYITSTGSQYINTGIVLNSPYNIEHYADVQFDNTSINFETICGFMSTTGTLNKPRYGIHKYQQKWMIGINYTEREGSTVDTNRHKMLFITASTNHQSLSIDNTVLINNATMDNTGYSTNNMPLYLFARNNENTTIVNYFSGNIGRTWLKQNGEYLYDYYPCMKNGEVGMYDKVSGNFLKSDSGTNFIAGPMVSGSEINMCMCKDYILTNQLIEI